MAFGHKDQNEWTHKKAAPFALPTHSQIVNGNPVETCRPYPCVYMSETIFNFKKIITRNKRKSIAFLAKYEQ